MEGLLDKGKLKGLMTSFNTKIKDDIEKIKDEHLQKQSIVVGGNIGVYAERNGEDEAILKIYGHEKFIEQGYVPVIFRYLTSTSKRMVSEKRDELEEGWFRYRCKGWNVYGNPDCVRITEDNVVEFSTNQDNYLTMSPEGFSPLAENMISEMKDLDGKLFVKHGRRKILIRRPTESGTIHRSVRLRYGIGFVPKPEIAWPNDYWRRKITHADLVSNLAEFYVGYNFKTKRSFPEDDLWKWGFGISKTV